MAPKSDRDQIQELMAIYAGALDRKDYDGIVACFTPSATVEYTGFSHALRGPAAIIDHMKLALDPLDASQHMFANFIIAIERDTARLTCDILAQHVRRGAPGGDTYLAGGKYDVLLERAAGQWKFARVSAQSVWGDGNRGILPRAG
jgi:hypothetical protein